MRGHARLKGVQCFAGPAALRVQRAAVLPRVPPRRPAVLPAAVLHGWDFNPRPVSAMAADYLASIAHRPCSASAPSTPVRRQTPDQPVCMAAAALHVRDDSHGRPAALQRVMGAQRVILYRCASAAGSSNALCLFIQCVVGCAPMRQTEQPAALTLAVMWRRAVCARAATGACAGPAQPRVQGAGRRARVRS